MAPLCVGCLGLVQAYEKKTGAQPCVLHSTLRNIFGGKRRDWRKVFAPLAPTGRKSGFSVHTIEQANGIKESMHGVEIRGDFSNAGRAKASKEKKTRRPRTTQEKDKYIEYLASPEWKAKRQEVISRCGGICEECKNAAVEHVHHVTYERLEHELLTDLMGLCFDCHQTKHPHRKLNKRRLVEKKRNCSRGPYVPEDDDFGVPPSPEQFVAMCTLRANAERDYSSNGGDEKFWREMARVIAEKMINPEFQWEPFVCPNLPLRTKE